MKVLFISADNIYLVPYMNMYINLLKQCNVEWDVIYWDKNQNEVQNDSRYYRFVTDGKSPICKIGGYIKFRQEIIKLMKTGEYSFYIPLHPICSLIIWRKLSKKNKGKYVYDVRDYSYEKYAIVRWIEKKLVDNSAINIISSEGFKNFLPKGEYEVAHNLPNYDCTQYKQLNTRVTEVYHISYIGLVRFMEQNKRIIDFFKNDSRFHLDFIGTNAEELKLYCEEKQVNNVTLIGTFKPEQTLEYCEKADMIMNMYGNHTPLLDYALSNKLYLAAMLYKPILVCKDTFMEKISTEYDFGYTVELKDSKELDALYDYIKNLDREFMMKRCDEFSEMVVGQNRQMIEKLTAIFEILKKQQ